MPKGYDDYDKELDFVMMFIPSEPAFMAALQGDPDLWNFAYDRRILFINPTNLITSLKLIVDLWKREYQNRNAQEIAERPNCMTNLSDLSPTSRRLENTSVKRKMLMQIRTSC